MSIIKRYSISFIALIAIIIAISACSPQVGVKPPSSGSSLTPLQVLQNSSNAMKQLKSSHVSLQSSDNLKTTGSSSSSGSSNPQNVTINITGSGDEALPNQEQLKLSINALNQVTNLTEIVQGNQVYVQNPQGKWYVLNTSQLEGMVGNPFAGISLDQNTLLGLIQNTQITDHGTESLNGQSLRHITAALDKDALRQLLTNNPQLKGALGTQDIDTLLNNTKSFLSTIDVWIDETHFYVHRTQFKLNLTANTGAVSTVAPKTTAVNLNTIVDLSNFNVPVTITPPTNAIPTDNPGAVFGIGKP
jgi:hypothetical protein